MPLLPLPTVVGIVIDEDGGGGAAADAANRQWSVRGHRSSRSGEGEW